MASDPVERFSDRAADYVKFRPSYPPAAIDAVLAGLGDPGTLTAADVGAGTGISARLLAGRGVRVLAVEPNAAMRAAAQTGAGVEWIDAPAEGTGLPERCVGLVVCAQSFHWFRGPEALREFARILSPGGRLALMWNDRDRADPTTAGYARALLEAGGRDPGDEREFDADLTEGGGLFVPCRLLEFANTQSLDLEGLIGRALSASYAPRSGPAHEPLVALLRELHARHAEGGRVKLVYTTRVFLSELAPGA